MQNTLLNFIKNRTFLALCISSIAGLTTLLSKFIFINEWLINLSLGTVFCTFIVVWLSHYLIFSWLNSSKLKYALLISFPILYGVFLITTFATFTTLLNITWFKVPILNQIYLQMWAFLGDAYIFAVFTPKAPFILTCLLVMIGFHLALKQQQSSVTELLSE